MHISPSQIVSVGMYRLFEYAALLVATLAIANLCKRYSKTLVFALNEIPKDLLSQGERINYELKRVSATAKKSIGAGLVSLNGLITALVTIQNVLLNPNLRKKEMQEVLQKYARNT